MATKLPVEESGVVVTNLGTIVGQLMKEGGGEAADVSAEAIGKFVVAAEESRVLEREGDKFRVFPALAERWQTYLRSLELALPKPLRDEDASGKRKKATVAVGAAKTRAQLAEVGLTLVNETGGQLTGGTQLLKDGHVTAIVQPSRQEAPIGDPAEVDIKKGHEGELEGADATAEALADVVVIRQPAEVGEPGAAEQRTLVELADGGADGTTHDPPPLVTVTTPSEDEFAEDRNMPVDTSASDGGGSGDDEWEEALSDAGDNIPGLEEARALVSKQLAHCLDLSSRRKKVEVTFESNVAPRGQQDVAASGGTTRGDLLASLDLAQASSREVQENVVVKLRQGGSGARPKATQSSSGKAADHQHKGNDPRRKVDSRSSPGPHRRKDSPQRRQFHERSHFDSHEFELSAFSALTGLRTDDPRGWGHLSMSARVHAQHKLRAGYMNQAASAEERRIMKNLWGGVVGKVEAEDACRERLHSQYKWGDATPESVDWNNPMFPGPDPVNGDFTLEDAYSRGGTISERQRAIRQGQETYESQQSRREGHGRPGESGRGTTRPKTSTEEDDKPMGAFKPLLVEDQLGQQQLAALFSGVTGKTKKRQQSQAEAGSDTHPPGYYLERDGRPSYGSASKKTPSPQETIKTADAADRPAEAQNVPAPMVRTRGAASSSDQGWEKVMEKEREAHGDMMKNMFAILTQLRGQLNTAEEQAETREARHLQREAQQSEELAALRGERGGAEASRQRCSAGASTGSFCNGAQDSHRPTPIESEGGQDGGEMRGVGVDTTPLTSLPGTPILPETQRLVDLRNDQNSRFITPRQETDRTERKAFETPTPFMPATPMNQLRDVGSNMTYTNVLRMLSTFSGPTATQSWVEYRARFERLLEDHGIAREHWAKLMFAKLDDKAGASRGEPGLCLSCVSP